MSNIAGMAIRITPLNRNLIAVVNAGVPAPEAEDRHNDEYFILPYEPTAKSCIVPGYVFRENFEFAAPRSDNYFVQIREI